MMIQEDMFNPVPDDTKLPEIKDLIAKGAIFFCNSSAGKDSQRMYIYLNELVPHEQLVVVHADLGEVEWPGVIDHINNTIEHDLNVVKANKTFFEMVRSRGMFPSPRWRQCTSDIKRQPLMKFIRNYMKGVDSTIAVNCTGVRAAESNNRAKQAEFEINASETVFKRVKRTVYNWKPIFNLSDDEVYDGIYAAGQRPFWAYGKRGELNERLSCVLCIMGSVKDLRHGARENPELYKKYVELEKEINHTMFMNGKNKLWLEDKVGIKVSDLLPVRKTQNSKPTLGSLKLAVV